MGEHLAVRPAVSADDVEAWIRRSWGAVVIAVHRRSYDVRELPAFVAIDTDELVGVLTYVRDRDELEIVSCDADPPGRGTGRLLVAAALDLARRDGASRVWCTTTNDNLPALGFWQAMGFTFAELRPDAVRAARRLKPAIPMHGYRGLPVRDELDLEFVLGDTRAQT